MPFLATLGKATGENVYLRIRDGMESETIAIYQTDPGLRLYSEVGQRGRCMPAPAGAAGTRAEAVQTQCWPSACRAHPRTRTDSAWIAADLQRIRARGYLVTPTRSCPVPSL